MMLKMIQRNNDFLEFFVDFHSFVCSFFTSRKCNGNRFDKFSSTVSYSVRIRDNMGQWKPVFSHIFAEPVFSIILKPVIWFAEIYKLVTQEQQLAKMYFCIAEHCLQMAKQEDRLKICHRLPCQLIHPSKFT